MPKVCPNCNTQYSDAFAVCPNDGATLRAADPGSDFIGTIVADRYVITETLGEGGMGKVYRARHVRLPREAAIKVLHPHMVQDPAAVARFDREAANASRIDHENVVRVFDFGETNEGLVYLAMEFVAGRTLKDILETSGPLSLTRTAAIVRQVADGLDAAHRLGIVHRDLKPDNILVVKDELGQEKCKIADFGIAKAIGSGEKSLTQTGFVIGTPEYMSPEQLLGEEIDHRSDVYSLALVAHQCLTNETAFDSKTPDRGMMARLTNQPRTLAHLCPEQSWPKDLQAVLNRGLDRQRARRYESAGQFAGAFEKAMTSAVTTPPAPRPVAPPPPPPRPRTPQPPVAAVKREPIVGRTSRQTPRSTPAPQLPPQPFAQPSAPSIPSFRLSRLIPRLPIVRWTMTALVVGFAWLLVTEGSIPRALRKAGAIARRAQSTILGGGSGGARSAPASVASPDGASPTAGETPEPVMPTLSNPPSVKPPVGSEPTPPPAAAPPATNPPANPPGSSPPDGIGRDSLGNVSR